MNAPKDQVLFLTIFVALCLSVILATWIFMPVYHHGEYYEEEVEYELNADMNLVLPPGKLIHKMKVAIKQGEAALIQLEAEGGEEESKETGEGEKAEEK